MATDKLIFIIKGDFTSNVLGQEMKFLPQRSLLCATAFLFLTIVAASSDEKAVADSTAAGTFQEGLKVGSGRFAWIHAAENRMYLQLVERERVDELKEHFVENMWLSIIELDEFVRNEKAAPEEREAAERILQKVVEYFVKNPKKIEKPEGTDLSDSVEQRVKKKIVEGKVSGEVKPVLEDIASAANEPLKELKGMFEAMLVEAYKRDIKTQEVLERLASAEQDGTDQPATAPESKPEGGERPQPESKVRPQ